MVVKEAKVTILFVFYFQVYDVAEKMVVEDGSMVA